MNRIKQEPLKFIKIFSILYIVFSLVTRIIYYATTSAVYRYPISFSTIFSFIISIVPISLFIIYIYKFFGTNKTQILLPLSYGVSIFLSLVALVQNIRNVRYISYYSSAAQALRYGVIDSLINILLGIIGLAFAIFFFITSLSNFKQLKIAKKIVLINAAISIFSMLFGFILDLVTGYSITIIYGLSFLISISSLLSHMAYIVFWLYAVDMRNMPPLEYDLITLKKKFENGEITEADYNLAKERILNEL